MPKNPRGLCFPAAFFFWLGLAVAVATCSIVFVHDTELVGRLERAPVPFSWLLGGLILVVPYVGGVLSLSWKSPGNRDTYGAEAGK